MSVENVDLSSVRAGRVLHLSGITAALSDACLSLLRELTAPGEGRPMVSFDVNHRAGLWRDAEGPRVLLELARRADIVFVGEDEAEGAWGVAGGPAAIRAVLPEPGVLVVKQGAKGATAFVSAAAEWGLVAQFPAPLLAAGSRAAGAAPDPQRAAPRKRGQATTPPACTFVPALDVDVVATTGAGDAFAAGFLSATLRNLPMRDRIRHGHLWAAAALTVPGDLAVPPSRAHADRLAAVGDEAWGTLRLGPGWTQADRAPEEVHTP
jgi:2-dehydro-3-deoxygluconokinase